MLGLGTHQVDEMSMTNEVIAIGKTTARGIAFTIVPVRRKRSN
jgi:hypothetical protein